MISRRITGALAWAGLVIVVAVPAADMVMSRLAPGTAAAIAPEEQVAPAVTAKRASSKTATVPVVAAPKQAAVATKPAVVDKVAVAAPKVEPAAATIDPPAADVASSDDAVSGDPIGDYLATHKSLPSYLTPSAGTAGGSAPAETASVPIQQTPAQPSAAEQAPTPAAVAETPAEPQLAAQPAPVKQASIEPPAAVAPVVTAPPVPMPAVTRPKVPATPTATEADLKDWKSGTLADYLRQHGLLTENAPAN